MATYGFLNLKDMADARITGTLTEAVNDAINAAVAQYNADTNAMLNLFADRTTLPQERYAQISASSLQPLDDNGRALPVKPSGYYNTAYPLRTAGSAWGANYVTRAKMTVGDAERATAMMLSADANWVKYQLLAGLFASASYTFTDDLFGSLTVQPLALSSDNVTYPVTGGTAATDTHQLAQANAIGNGADNPYTLIYADLVEHPNNSGQVVSFIASSLVATTRALSTFNPIADPNIQPGSATDVVIGDLGVSYPGKLIGYDDAGVWIVEWPSVPSGYIVSTMTGGDRALGMREDPETELNGFHKVADRDDHPFYESQWMRRAGFGARNRVGAVVTRIGNGTYAAPTGYAPPIG